MSQDFIYGDIGQEEIPSIPSIDSVLDDIIDTNLGYNEDLDTNFELYFHDGFSFKYLLNFQKETGDVGGNFILSKEGIKFQQTNKSNTIFNNVKIFGKDLLYYKYDSKNPEYLVGCCFADICPITDQCGKKDGLRIFKLPQKKNIYFNPIDGDSENENELNLTDIYPKEIEHKEFALEGCVFGKPTAIIAAKKWKKKMDNISGKKSKYTTWKSDGKTIFVTCCNNQGISNSIIQLGKENKRKTENTITPKDNLNNAIYSHVVSNSTVKSLAKYINLSEKGTVKVYINETCIKLETNIGTYGVIETYLRSCKN